MKFILASLFTLITTMCYSQTNLIIKGTAPLLKDGTEIYLEQVVPRRFSSLTNQITTRVKDHHFEFTLKTDGVELYYLSGSKGGKQIFLQPGKANVIVADSILRRVSVTNNLTDIEYNEYVDQLINDSLSKMDAKAIYDYYHYVTNNKNPDTLLAANKRQKMDSLRSLSDERSVVITLDWVKQHPNSYINTKILYNQIKYMPEDEVKKVFGTIQAGIANDIWGKEIKYQIDNLFVGGTAPSFSQADTSGRQVSLASFRGKYVLLDFWASWCIPCRGENPNVVKAMAKFKNRNFTILSISFDDKKASWLGAIKQDHLNWTHLSELKAWNNETRFKYYINSIPSNYLIDPDGKIIAKNLHGEELNTALDKLVK